jgi:hypothetical protein
MVVIAFAIKNNRGMHGVDAGDDTPHLLVLKQTV